MDVAHLGLEVDSSLVNKSTADLGRFRNAANAAQNAAIGLANASGRMDPSQIAAMARNMGSVQKASDAAARSLNAEALAAQRAATAGRAYAASTRATAQSAAMAQQQMRNLAFQFQDIGTMLAMGQNPFMLLAQQLPQVTMYGGQLTGVMAALRSTIAGLFSPLGIATTAFVLLGSTAISYFTDLWTRGTQSEDVLQSLETSVSIATTDRPFADQVAAHNKHGKQSGCWK